MRQALFLLTMMLGFYLYAMDEQSYVVPAKNNIRLIFLGESGAGKSTLISAFYNFARDIKWDAYPKLFPIKTDFHVCNVKEYEHRNIENHDRGQLGSVTQSPSEYVTKTKHYIANMIDCPGSADSRGIEVDTKNSQSIAEFIAKTGSFNAICIVLKGSVNRGCPHAQYYIEQIKSIIPKKAHDRIFICATSTLTPSSSLKEFIRAADLPHQNIFAFDNFALTKEGHVPNLMLQTDSEEEYDDFFGEDEIEIKNNTKRKITIEKIKSTWEYSRKQFIALLKKARGLGRYSSKEMEEIFKAKTDIHDKILAAYRKIDDIEQYELKLDKVQHELKDAKEDYKRSKLSKSSKETALRQALLEKKQAAALKAYSEYTAREETKTTYKNTYCLRCAVVCHRGCNLDYEGEHYYDHLVSCASMSGSYCKECPSKCRYFDHRHRYFEWITVTRRQENESVKTRQKEAKAHYINLKNELDAKKAQYNKKFREKNEKIGILAVIGEKLSELKKDKDNLQKQIIEGYVELEAVSMSPINVHLGDYYDVCIKKEQDFIKQQKLIKEKKFYLERIRLYQQKMKEKDLL